MTATSFHGSVGHLMLPYAFVLASLACFSGASVWYGEFAKKFSSAWMSLFKASIASFAFFISTLILVGVGWVSLESFAHPANLLFFLSGVIGLGIGDVFLIKAFASLGSARTLIIFSFEPVVLGIFAYFLFDQTVTLKQFMAIFILIACVWLISAERSRIMGHWDFKGVLCALAGVFLDNIGVIMTRQAFNLTNANVFSANFIRTLGAISVLLVYFYSKRQKVYSRLLELNSKDKWTVVLASFAGTYVSLTFWLSAVKVGHLATLSALAGIAPLVGGLWEWYLLGKKPTRTLLYCLFLTIPGLYLILS